MARANLAAGAVLVPLALLVARPWEDWRAWRGWLVVLYGALPVTLGGETIHAYHVIGALLVAAGVYLATRPVA